MLQNGEQIEATTEATLETRQPLASVILSKEILGKDDVKEPQTRRSQHF